MKSLLEGTESSKYSEFSLAEYGSLPLAELLLGKEESFLLLSNKVVSLPV